MSIINVSHWLVLHLVPSINEPFQVMSSMKESYVCYNLLNSRSGGIAKSKIFLIRTDIEASILSNMI